MTGWMPFHLVLRRPEDDRLVGCVPLYVKSHSYGEYVFDHQWAQLSSYLGERYYPKLQCCVPFTPVTGDRLLVNSALEKDVAAVKQVLASGLKQSADSVTVSSMHLTFNSEEEQSILEKAGFFSRLGVQYHWTNHGYTTFDEFLMELKSSKRRTIRQERRSIEQSGIIVERLSGDDIKPQHLDSLYEFYANTCHQHHGNVYLNKSFFRMLGEVMSDRMLLVMAKTAADGYVAAAWNCIGSQALFGRSWGKAAWYDCKHLHFELCYYQSFFPRAIEAAIEMGLSRVEAGAQGEHKIQRGYIPRRTFSAHYIKNNDLHGRLLHLSKMETADMQQYINVASVEYTPFRVDIERS